MHIRVKFELHTFINLVKVVMEFKDDDEAIQVARGLKGAGFGVTLLRVTEDITSAEIEI
jgi:hypothetical protein